MWGHRAGTRLWRVPTMLVRPDRRRRSVRLPLHRYNGGLYFVTICTAGRRPWFGRVAGGRVVLSPAGRVARDEWLRTGDLRPAVRLDAFVVMPDHVHLLFGIVPADDAPADDAGIPRRRGTPPVCPYRAQGHDQATGPDRAPGPTGVTDAAPGSARRFGGADAGTVPTLMRQYKSVVTRGIRDAYGSDAGPVWQRGYHDRVIRTEREAENVRRYIAANPARWLSGPAPPGSPAR